MQQAVAMKSLPVSLLISVSLLGCVHSYGAATPNIRNEFDRCEYGRHLTKRCVGRTTDPKLRSCPKGFFCYSPVDGPGPCCRRDNPCSTGAPYTVNKDAVTCNQKKRCLSDHVCTSEENHAVCCPVHRLCPRPHNCPTISPSHCARPTTFRYKGGLICPGCDKNICKGSKKSYVE